jgi:oligopeptide transport system permease protein
VGSVINWDVLDYTLIVGLSIFYGSLLIVMNSVIDVIMRMVDPRMREEA